MITFVLGYAFYYVAALLGISIGYHRYFSHRSFEAGPVAEIVMLFFGQICGGRSAITWAAVHRMHHAGSDTESDPHSPQYKGWLNVLLSKWTVDYIPRKYIADLMKNPRVVFFHRYGNYIHVGWAIVVIASGGISGFISFVAMPWILAYLGFGLLNWLAHTEGEPADIPFANIFAPGEGWHKKHHDRPRDSRLHKYDIAGWTVERLFTKSK
jgi:fatty-acid desaturase